MNEKLLHTPEGMRDIYSSEYYSKLQLERRLLHAIRSYGYSDIQTPVIEYFEVMSSEKGTVSPNNMFRFFDREGNMLALRPDITPSVARCIAKYFKDETDPIRLCYKGSTFINTTDNRGALKECTQIGAELYNANGAEADCEMIVMAIGCMLEAGLKEFKVEIGLAGFFKALVRAAGIDSETEAELRKLIVNKNSWGIAELLEEKGMNADDQEIFIKLPEFFGSYEMLERVRGYKLPAEAKQVLSVLDDIYRTICLYGYENYLSFDLGMLGKYEYYTGIIFNGYTYGNGEPVISGGRYDKLAVQFGKDASAIGMAVFIDRLMQVLAMQKIEEPKEPGVTYVVCEGGLTKEACELVKKLRAEDRKVILEALAKGEQPKDYENVVEIIRM